MSVGDSIDALSEEEEEEEEEQRGWSEEEEEEEEEEDVDELGVGERGSNLDEGKKSDCVGGKTDGLTRASPKGSTIPTALSLRARESSKTSSADSSSSSSSSLGETPYSCDRCGRKYKFPNFLKVHQRRPCV